MDPNHTWPKCISQNIDNREDNSLMIPKERPETGGREGLINARDHYSLTASDPSPFPGTLPPPSLPPGNLALEVRCEEKTRSHLGQVDV